MSTRVPVIVEALHCQGCGSRMLLGYEGGYPIADWYTAHANTCGPHQVIELLVQGERQAIALGPA